MTLTTAALLFAVWTTLSNKERSVQFENTTSFFDEVTCTSSSQIILKWAGGHLEHTQYNCHTKAETLCNNEFPGEALEVFYDDTVHFLIEQPNNRIIWSSPQDGHILRDIGCYRVKNQTVLQFLFSTNDLKDADEYREFYLYKSGLLKRIDESCIIELQRSISEQYLFHDRLNINWENQSGWFNLFAPSSREGEKWCFDPTGVLKFQFELKNNKIVITSSKVIPYEKQ